MKSLIMASLVLFVSLNSFAEQSKNKRKLASGGDCSASAKSIAEQLGSLNDRRPAPANTTVTRDKNNYSVETVSTDGNRIGNFTVVISNETSCFIKSVLDNDQ